MKINNVKCKNIYDFVSDFNSGRKAKALAGPNFMCKGIEGDSINVKNCFSCGFCLLQDQKLYNAYTNTVLYSQMQKKIEEAFKGKHITDRFNKVSLNAPFKTLSDFTKVNETKHISPWVAGLMEKTSSKYCEISLEVQVPNKNFPRGGRMDVCGITDEYMFLLEAKISVLDSLKDERFVDQYGKYIEVINESIKNNKLKYDLVLVIGGNELDLYPPNSSECTSDVGNVSSRFYKLLNDFNIRFISANALWLSSMKYLSGKNEFAWDKFYKTIFEDPNVVGVVSSGKILKQHDYIIEAI